jgi:hypothetical protein
MKLRWILLISVAIALLMIGMVVAHRRTHIASAFSEARSGEPKEAIVQRLGKPWRQAPCGQTLGGTFQSSCSQELIYRHPLAPIIPEYWSFQYDSKGFLSGTYRYMSP